MIDLHLAYGDAAVYLGADTRFSVVDAIENLHRLDSAFFKSLLVHTSSGLDLLPSPYTDYVGSITDRAVVRRAHEAHDASRVARQQAPEQLPAQEPARAREEYRPLRHVTPLHRGRKP